jgi:MFS transporter, FHS family, L-fucose permease
MNKETSLSRVLPVLFGFFIMGFVDVVGISTSYVKQDFNISDSLANLLPMMVFLWFAIFAIPTGLMMNKLGRKNTVLVSMFITLIAMLVPLTSYNFIVVLIAFAFLGIGNTILQVSLNPLLTNVVRGDRLTSSITLGQFVKAIASLLGPVIAGIAAGKLGNWKLIFPIFGGLTLLSSLWLLLTPVRREQVNEKPLTFIACLSLLKDPSVLIFFFGILLVVGIDVGLNTSIPKYLMERTGLPLEKAGLGTSLYFAARTLGTFIGAIVLVKVSGRKFFIISMIAALIAMGLLLSLSMLWGILTMIFILGFAVANVFPIIFSMALRIMPGLENEISGLMIMGVAGGAIIPPLMGLMADKTSQAGALLILLMAILYLLYTAFRVKDNN